MSNVKWSSFTDVGTPGAGATFVGLQGGVNVQFDAGSIAAQDSNSVDITGGVISVLTLRAPFSYQAVTADIDLLPTDSLSSFEYTVAATDIADALGLSNYTNGFTLELKNTSGGDCTFTPFTGEFIDGNSVLTIVNQGGYVIKKDNGQWSIVGQGGAAVTSSINFSGDSGFGTPFAGTSVTIQAGNSTQNCGSSVWFDATSPNITLNLSDSNSNTILGSYSGTSGLLGSGGGANTVLGSGSFDSVNGPATNNILIGFSVANAYTNQESGNIIISNSFPGTPGQNNTTVIGFSGDTPTTTACYIDGINSVDSSGFTSPKAVYVDSVTGQLGYGTTGASITFSGDFGTPFATSSVSIITNIALRQCGSTVRFSASTPDIALNVSDSNGNTMLGFQAGNLSNVAPRNTGFGQGVLSSVISMGDNSAFGYNCMPVVTQFGNSGFGSLALLVLDSGVYNTCIGLSSGDQITAGAYNIGLGYQAGHMWISGDSSNICIGNVGANEGNTIRIGTQGSGNGQQNACYIAGIAGISVSNLNLVTIDTSTGQLGSEAASTLQTTFSGDPTFGTAFQTASVNIRANINSLGCGSSVWFDATTPNITLNVTDSNVNTIIGNGSGTAALLSSGGSANTVFGAQSFNAITNAANNNVIVGYASGTAYSSFESSNILIGSLLSGSTGENNTTRIGFLNSLTSQTACYIDGIANQIFLAGSPTPQAVIIDTSTGQLISSQTPFGTPWSDQSMALGMLAGNGYFLDAALTATLPSPANTGDTVQVITTTASSVVVQAGGSDIIQIGPNVSSAGGSATSTSAGNTLTLVYNLNLTTWFVNAEVATTWVLA